MAKRRLRRRTVDTNVDMTPMLDIVFIMLIFFIVTATFLDEHGLDLTQPFLGEAVCDCGSNVHVYLYEDGSASVDGIKTNLKSILARVHAFRADYPQASVVLGGDKATPVGNVVYLKDKFDIARINVTLKIQTQ